MVYLLAILPIFNKGLTMKIMTEERLIDRMDSIIENGGLVYSISEKRTDGISTILELWYFENGENKTEEVLLSFSRKI